MVKKIIGLLILVAIVGFVGFHWYSNHQEEKKVITLLNQFKEENPSISIPSDFNLKKDTEWDSGAVQYELQKSGKNYHVLIENQEVTRIFTKFPEKQIYPAKQHEMGKGEYAIAVSKLLGDTLLNIQNTQNLINSPEISNEVVIQLDGSLQDSIQLYEDFKSIIPPEDWKALHDEILTLWNEYIVGEQGLVDQVQKAWDNSAEERQVIMDVAKEKGAVVGDYGMEFGKLIGEFLGEITGLSQ